MTISLSPLQQHAARSVAHHLSWPGNPGYPISPRDVDRQLQGFLDASDPVDIEHTVGPSTAHGWTDIPRGVRLAALQAHELSPTVRAVVGVRADHPEVAADLLDRTAIHIAAEAGNVDGITKGVADGLPVAWRDKVGRTALMCAIDHGHPDAVHALLELGAEPNEKTTIDGKRQTALERAAELGATECVQALLDDPRTDINARGKDGRTALHAAMEKGHHKASEVLLEAGADPSLRDAYGKTAIDVAEGPAIGLMRERLSGPDASLDASSIGIGAAFGAACGASTAPSVDTGPAVSVGDGDGGISIG